MKFPDHLELIVPTIKALKEMGGIATPSEITKKVIEIENYPEEIQTEPQKGDGYRTKLEYRLAWSRTYMKKFLNAVEDKSRGQWTLTADGLKLDIRHTEKIIELAIENKKIQEKEWKTGKQKIKPKNEESDEDSEEDTEEWKSQLLDIINNISPKSFEKLCQRILRESGCENVKVSGGANDKGIDGSAFLHLGLITFPIKFQCKRYGSSIVTPAQIREFRGSLGQIDKGIFLTTSRFTKLAEEEALDPTKGKTIDLIDGNKLCDLLREYKLGIQENNEVALDKDFFESF